MEMKYVGIVLAALLLLSACSVERTSGAEELEIKGSDTLLELISAAAERFGEEHPQIKVTVTGGGSGTGIAALLNKEIEIATSSRPMKDEEKVIAMQKGIEVQELLIARDMLSMIVHPSNEVYKLTMEEIAGIYSGEISNWQELGGKDKEITLYGRQSTSGTYSFFMEEVVQGDYAPTMRNLEGSQAIVDAVSQDDSGIGYVGIGYVVDEKDMPLSSIKLVLVGEDKEGPFFSSLDARTYDRYPINRPLYLYSSGQPQSAKDLFLEFMVSLEGQKVVEDSGFVSIR